MQRVPGLLMVTHCGERHQAPPDAVIKWPVLVTPQVSAIIQLITILEALPLKCKHEAGEHEDSDNEHHKDQAELLCHRIN